MSREEGYREGYRVGYEKGLTRITATDLALALGGLDRTGSNPVFAERLYAALMLRITEAELPVATHEPWDDVHPFTCGLCVWGRDGAYHDEAEYQRHMTAAHS